MGKPADVVRGAKDSADALKRLKQDTNAFVRPVVRTVTSFYIYLLLLHLLC